jgi:hypothetical protein
MEFVENRRSEASRTQPTRAPVLSEFLRFETPGSSRNSMMSYQSKYRHQHRFSKRRPAPERPLTRCCQLINTADILASLNFRSFQIGKHKARPHGNGAVLR